MQGKKVIIILELDILRSGAQVGQKIGSPVPIQQDGSVNENDKKESMKQARKSTEDESNDGQPASKKPFQQVCIIFKKIIQCCCNAISCNF